MEMHQPSTHLHPLMAGAAVSIMLVSLLGAAAIAGILPNSHGTVAGTAQFAAQSVPLPQVAAAPAVVREVVTYKTVVHHRYVQHQAAPARQISHAPAYQPPAPVARNNPVGIGVGAIVGGLIGSQVGGGNGRTLATIAGAVGGGFVGNEIAKRNQ
jgi:uncharacterized protein YcfJ